MPNEAADLKFVKSNFFLIVYTRVLDILTAIMVAYGFHKTETTVS